MPTIWNVNNDYNLKSKKISSKLPVVIDEDIKGQENIPLQSKVEGLEKEDINILKKMVKHNIPLTRENITFIKSLFQFNMKINIDNSEIDSFILKYVNSKGISSESEQGKQIIKILKSFFVNFKGMKLDDILLFLENDIDFTCENIESYNKLFGSSDKTIKEFFDNIKSNLIGIEVESKEIEKSRLIPKDVINNKNEIGKELSEEGNKDKTLSSSLVSKLYDSNDLYKGKVSMLAVLKSMIKLDDNLLREPIKDILISNKELFTTSEYSSALGDINNLSDEEFVRILKEVLEANVEIKVISKDSIKSVLNNLFGKNIKLSEVDLKKIEDIIEYKFQDIYINEKVAIEEKIIKSNVSSKIISSIEESIITGKSEKLLSSDEIIKTDISKKVDDIKGVIKELLIASKGDGDGAEKVVNLIRNNINEFKLFNTISNEYYYLDIPINREETEYPCKLIIKDSRKDGKKIDRTNVKVVVTVKTVNLGVVDGFLVIKDNGLDVDLKCDKNYMKVFELSKNKLEDDLQKLGFNINIKVSIREEYVTLSSCREFFNDKSINGIDIKV